MHKKTAQGQVIHGTNPEVPVGTMVACSALCERSVGCALAVWTPGSCRLKSKMKPLSMRADLTSSVWISHRLSRAHDSTRFERLRALWSSPDPDNCGDEPTKPSRYVVWTYWHSHPPEIVLRIVHSWRLYSPSWTVRLLNRHTVQCYLPDLEFLVPPIASIQLTTDIIRLELLLRYGGVWLDATVLLTESLDSIVGPTGFRAISNPDYVTPGLEDDFIESWFLADDAGSYLIRAWRTKLLEVVLANNGTVKGISSTSVYSPETTRAYPYIAEYIGNSAKHWSEYLVIYVCFTWLHHNNPRFHKLVRSSHLYTADKVGYMANRQYGWNMNAVNQALNAPAGSHSLHERLVASKIIKLSTGNLRSFQLDTNSLFDHITRIRRIRRVNCTVLYSLPHAPPPPPPQRVSRMSSLRGIIPMQESGAALQLACTLQQMGLPNLSGKRWLFKVVMARYNEDISWSEMYEGHRVILQKGTGERPESDGTSNRKEKSSASIPSTDAFPYDEHMFIPNVGDECVSFLRYVIDNYDLLPEYVAFTQAGLDKGHAWIRPKDFGAGMLINMLKEARESGCSTPLVQHGPNIRPRDGGGGDWSFFFNGTPSATDTAHVERYMKVSRRTSLNFGGYFHDVLELGAREGRTRLMHELRFYPSALMVISRSNILSRPRQYYARILKQVDYSRDTLECHYFERSWYYIFNCDVRY